MDTVDAVKKARREFLYKHPFFSRGLFDSQILIEDGNEEEEDGSQSAGRVDGNDYILNDTVIQANGMCENDVKYILGELILHSLLLHTDRRGSRDEKLWDAASDIIAAQLLNELGIPMPTWSIAYKISKQIDIRQLGDTVEKVYDALKKNNDNNRNRSSRQAASNAMNGGKEWNHSATNDGGNKDCDGDGSSGKKKERASQIDKKVKAEDALAYAKACGNKPECLERAIHQVYYKPLDFKEILALIIDEVCRSDWSFVRPNRRYNDVYLPSFSGGVGDKRRIVYAIDTSGSMSEEQVSIGVNEGRRLAAMYPNTEIICIYADAAVEGVEKITPFTEALNPVGGGGTDYRPVFELIEKSGVKPTVLIYFTDGECWGFPDKSSVNYPVLWILTYEGNGGQRPFEPPMGQITYMTEEDVIEGREMLHDSEGSSLRVNRLRHSGGTVITPSTMSELFRD